LEFKFSGDYRRLRDSSRNQSLGADFSTIHKVPATAVEACPLRILIIRRQKTSFSAALQKKPA